MPKTKLFVTKIYTIKIVALPQTHNIIFEMLRRMLHTEHRKIIDTPVIEVKTI